MQPLKLFYKALLAFSVCFFNSATANNGNIVIENSTISGANIVIDGYSNNENTLKGSGPYQLKNQNLPHYDAIIIHGSFNVNYYRKNKSSAKISANRNLIPFVNVSVKNNTLYLKMDKSYSTRKPIVIDVFSPTLNAVTIHGASDVHLNAIRADDFKIHLTGSGDIIANGRTNKLNIAVSGSGDIKAKNLISQKASVELKGSADIELTAQKALNINISGSGDVTYFGNPPQISKNISGAGDIMSGD